MQPSSERCQGSPLNMLNSCFDIRNRFAVIAPHQEHPNLNAVSLCSVRSPLDLLDFYAALHRIEYFLASALRPYPDSIAPHLGESLQHLVCHHPIGAGDGLEGHTQTPLFQLT